MAFEIKVQDIKNKILPALARIFKFEQTMTLKMSTAVVPVIDVEALRSELTWYYAALNFNVANKIDTLAPPSGTEIQLLVVHIASSTSNCSFEILDRDTGVSHPVSEATNTTRIEQDMYGFIVRGGDKLQISHVNEVGTVNLHICYSTRYFAS